MINPAILPQEGFVGTDALIGRPEVTPDEAARNAEKAELAKRESRPFNKPSRPRHGIKAFSRAGVHRFTKRSLGASFRHQSNADAVRSGLLMKCAGPCQKSPNAGALSPRQNQRHQNWPAKRSRLHVRDHSHGNAMDDKVFPPGARVPSLYQRRNHATKRKHPHWLAWAARENVQRSVCHICQHPPPLW